MTDVIGESFGRLSVISETQSLRDSNNKKIRVVVARCVCGNVKEYRLKNLRAGNTKSCGCLDAQRLRERNEKASEPQKWTIDGDAAWIELRGQKVLVDASDAPIVGCFRWYMDDNGYVDSMQCDPMHRLLFGLTKGDRREVDHKNHVTWDNRRLNIRIVTSSQNKMNCRAQVHGTSRFKGVGWDKDRKKWRAQIQSTFIGRFDSEEAAAVAYDAAARKRFGEFAYLNFGAQHA